MVLTEKIPTRVLGTGAWHHLDARWTFDPADPFVVLVSYGPAPGVPWLLGRELLTDGLHRPTGHHDVRVFPSSLGRTLFVQLRPPSGTSLMEMPADRVAAFLARCDGLAPAGSEAPAVDAALAALLGRTD